MYPRPRYLGYKGKKKSSRWTYLDKYLDVKAGKGKDKLRPGGVILGQQNNKSGIGHIAMYVDNGIVKKIYQKKLKGTKSDSGAPAKGASWVSGHRGYNCTAGIGGAGWALATSSLYDKGSVYKVLRCPAPQKSGYGHGKLVK